MTSLLPKSLEAYSEFSLNTLHTGSRVICDPAPTDTDDDYIMLVFPEKVYELAIHLLSDGWVVGGSMPVDTYTATNGDQIPVTNYGLEAEHKMKEDGTIDMSRVFHSWKKQTGKYEPHPSGVPTWIPEDNINLLVTCNEEYFDNFFRATALAQALNLTNKKDRIILFEALTRDQWPSITTQKRYVNIDGKTRYNFMKQLSSTKSTPKVEVDPPIFVEASAAQPSKWSHLDDYV